MRRHVLIIDGLSATDCPCHGEIDCVVDVRKIVRDVLRKRYGVGPEKIAYRRHLISSDDRKVFFSTEPMAVVRREECEDFCGVLRRFDGDPVFLKQERLIRSLLEFNHPGVERVQGIAWCFDGEGQDMWRHYSHDKRKDRHRSYRLFEDRDHFYLYDRCRHLDLGHSLSDIVNG